MWLFMLYGKIFVRHGEYGLGSFWAPTAPSTPYVPSERSLHRRAEPTPKGVSSILEIPVALVPGTGVPFYGTLMRMLGARVFDLGVRLSRRRANVHYLLHLLDLAQIEGSSLDAGMRKSPGVGLTFERRSAFTAHAMESLAALGEGVPMRELATETRARYGMADPTRTA
jgi:hypothetical protein